MPHASPTTGPHRRPRGVVILVELAHALTFIPLLILGIFLLPLLPVTAPLAAELERACARLAGARAPSSRPPGQGPWSWLMTRARQPGCWTRDLPLMLVGGALCAPSLLVAVGGGALSAILCALPSRLSAQAPLKLHLLAWSADVSSAGQGWWLVPLGAACLAAACGLLHALGRLRARLTQALTDSSQEERVATLTAEVGHLTAGRATLVDAFDAERTRIERDLHDGAQQELVALTMGLGMARVRALADEGETGAGRQALLADLDTAQDRAEAALRSLRETVHGIRPAVLTERGLAAALRDLAGRAPLPTTMSIADEEHLAALTSPVATAVYFAVSEALTNAARHAGDGATATVQLDADAQGLTAVVTDDKGLTDFVTRVVPVCARETDGGAVGRDVVVYGTEVMPVSSVDLGTLSWSTTGEKVQDVQVGDVDGDGLDDLVAPAAPERDGQLCLRGALTDGDALDVCVQADS